MQYFYGREKTVFMPRCATRVLLQECWKAVKEGTGDDNAARVTGDEISYYRCCMFIGARVIQSYIPIDILFCYVQVSPI
jgi:hypothetical protein